MEAEGGAGAGATAFHGGEDGDGPDAALFEAAGALGGVALEGVNAGVLPLKSWVLAVDETSLNALAKSAR